MPGPKVPDSEMPGIKKDMPGAEREMPRTDVEPTKKPYYEGYFGDENEKERVTEGGREGEREPTEEQIAQDTPPSQDVPHKQV